MSQTSRDNPIHLIGLGVGDLTPPPEARAILDSAELLAGGRRQLAAFAGHPAVTLPIAGSLDDVFARLAEARARGTRIVVLADGDPLFFGVGRRLLAAFGPENVVVLPGLSCVQHAAARLGLPWQEAAVVSLHGRSDLAPLFAALMERRRVFVYTDGAGAPAAVAGALLARGLDDAAAVVFEELGAAGERIGRLSLAETAQVQFSPLNLLLLEQPMAPPAQVIGRDDDFFIREKGLITKWPVRAAALASLRLEPGQTVWDVGAGCGAVSVEAAALVCRRTEAGAGRVVALERQPGRAAMIRENVRRARAWGVEVREGRAPDDFADLPDPDRVFIGGGLAGGALEAACRRLKPGGRLVASVVLLGSLTRALAVLDGLGWARQVVQIQAATSAPLAGDLRLTALSPVFLIAADKPK